MATLAILDKHMDRVRRGKLGLYRRRTVVGGSVKVVSIEALDDSFEDVQLNAIADERADGPFVRVSLSDL